MQRVAGPTLLLLADGSLRVARAEKAAVALQRDRAQARSTIDHGRITELQEARARYDATLMRELAAAGTLALRKAQFEALTGTPAVGLAALRGGLQPQDRTAGQRARLAIARSGRHHPRADETA